MEKRNEFITYLESIILLLLGIFFLGFPLIFATATSDTFILPKQITLASIAVLTLLLIGARMIAEKAIRIRKTPFDLPIALFTIAVLLSSVFSVNKADSLIAFVPLLFAVIIYFVLTNAARGENNSFFLISSLVLGGVLLAGSAVLSFFKIYVLPFAFTHAQNFTPIGNLLDQVIYLAVLFPIAGYFARNLIKTPKNLNSKTITFLIASIAIAMGLLVTVYQLFTPPAGGQKPLILPFETGFQTAFAAISQDTGRILQGFLVGSGFGTYVTDFTRFKQIAFNQNSALWTITFFRSSSAILELLATTGVLGISAFIFLMIRVIREIREIRKAKKENIVLASSLLLLIALFLLPLSFTVQTLFFIILGLFAVSSASLNEVEFQLLSFKRGVITLEPVTPKAEKSIILPFVFMLLAALAAGGLGYMGTKYALSDIAFQESLVAANSNNGSVTYQKQAKAISLFGNKDLYYRAFSQTNFLLANSLLSQQPKGSSPSAQIQQTITTLIQQSINAGRTSVAISPQTSLDWQNLSSIYRGLIGFGQNAENFAIATQQQTIALDPNNPQGYVNLGGIYFQLGNYENAQTQFQIAINLKPDYANAYYNLGHVFLNKKDYVNALTQFQTVKSLVVNDKTSTEQITKEIEDLQKNNLGQSSETSPSQNLNLNAPQTQLPPQAPKVKIPAPEVEPTASPSPSPK